MSAAGRTWPAASTGLFLSVIVVLVAAGAWWPSAAPASADATTVQRVELPSAGYSSEVGTMTVADAGTIDPPDFVRTWWIEDRGAAPSSHATDTAYLACHTDAQRPTAAVPCNAVGPENVPLGSSVLVTTDVEELRYTVVQARKVARDEFARDPEVWDVNPGRLVWVSCYLSEGRRTGYNFVVVAELED
ncbi:MAG TPA: hypothetical protein GXZ45_07830 [Propionibacterium sp.]|nr:hypothetical protein [Propionibacterium sp.]